MIVIRFDIPVVLSSAEAFKIPSGPISRCPLVEFEELQEPGKFQEFELAENIVVLRPCTFALVDLDKDTRLVKRCGGISGDRADYDMLLL